MNKTNFHDKKGYFIYSFDVYFNDKFDHHIDEYLSAENDYKKLNKEYIAQEQLSHNYEIKEETIKRREII